MNIILRLISILFLIIGVGQNLFAANYDFEDNGILYKIYSNKQNLVDIVGYNGNIPEDLIISYTKYREIGQTRYIDHNIHEIKYNAFANCTKLKTVAINSATAHLSSEVFVNCSNLTKVYLSQYSSQSLGVSENVFKGCSSIVEVHTANSSPSSLIQNNFDENVYQNAILIVPDGCSEIYRNTEGWNSFANIIEKHTLTFSVSTGGGVICNDVALTYTNNNNRVTEVIFMDGESAQLNFVPSDGYRLSKVLINGEDVTSQVVDNTYIIENVNINMTISVSYEMIPTFLVQIYCVNSWSGNAYCEGQEGKEVNVSGGSKSYPIQEGTNAIITIVPYEGYRIKSVKLEGVDVTSSVVNNQYTITNLHANVILEIEFEQIPVYTLTIKIEGNGMAIYDGETIRDESKTFSVMEGKNVNVMFSPDDLYCVKSVKLNDTDVTSKVVDNKYTIYKVSNDTTLEVVFGHITHSLTIKSIGNGTTTYGGTTIRGISNSFTIEEGEDALITFTPDEGYRIKSVKLNGTDVTSSVSNNQYTISDINCDNTLEVVFEQITYSLTITSIGNGVVSYNDISIRGKTSSFTIPYGFSTNMTITPDTGYKIKSVLLNGKDVSSGVVNNQYTISNITSDASVEVKFEQITYSLTIKATGNGTVTYAETTVRGKSSSFTISYGNNASISIVPDDGYRIMSVKLNDADITSSVKNNQYTIAGIKANTTLEVVFEQIPNYTFSIVSEGNGKVSFGSSIIRNQSKEFTIREGNSISISFTPDNGYRLASVKVNGENKTALVVNNQLSMENITSDMLIEVLFEAIPPTTYTLTIKASGNGVVTYEGTSIRGRSSSFTLVDGTYATITILPDEGYRIKCVKMNGTDVTSSVKNNAYSLKVEANTMIEVEFEAIPTYSLTIKSTGNGSATYNGTVVRGKSSSFTIVEGTDVVITFSPNTGYRIKSVKLNNTDVTSSVINNQYAIDNISSNFTLEVEYEAIPPTTYSLTIKATGNGTAAYNGTAIRGKSSSFTVTEGTSAVVTFTPDTGYKVKSVVLNGTNITTNVINNQYTINDITAETSLEVVFERITYIFTIASTGNGTATYNSIAVRGKSSSFTLEEGTKVVVTFAPDNGYSLKSVTLNSKDVTASVVNLQYTIANIDANTTLEVVFEAIPTYTINMVTAGNGSITYGSIVLRNQSREFSIREGGSISMKFIPDNGYRLASVKVNNQDMIGQVVNNQLIIEDIATDTNIEVAFEIIPITTYTFSIKSTGEGYVTYEGTIIRMQSKVFSVAEGTNAVVVITPDEGYRIKSIILNGTDVTSSVVNYMYSTKIESNATLEIEFMEDVMEFAVGNVNYKVVSYSDRTIQLASGNYGATLTVPATCTANDRQWTVIGVETNALANCTDLAAIIWNPEVQFNGNIKNPNLLLYVKDKKYAPTTVRNMVVDNVAEEITLSDAESGNPFYCPKAFTAQCITYEHNYSMTSGYQTCQGWETLALPFNVTTIQRQNGTEIVPREAWVQGSNKLPFWLYTLTELGWRPETTIAANTPYIISMPNNENYNSKYNISGVIQFIGTNVEVKASDNMPIEKNGNKILAPNYQYLPASESMYALNVNNQWCTNTTTEAEGSVFIKNLRPVHPFEAYLTVNGSEAARRIIPIFEEGESTGIINLPLRDDIIVDTWFTLDGRKLFSKPTEKGVYINKGKKVLVK